MDRSSTPASRVQSVDRAALLLRTVAEVGADDATAPALARRTGLNRATAWRLLTTMESHGLVSCNRVSGQWSLGLGLAYLAASTGLDRVRQSARAELERVSRESGETAALAVTSGAELTYVDQVAPPSVIAATWQDRTVPLHATSTGKAFLAVSAPSTRRQLLADGLTRYTETTIVDPAALEAELEQASADGYAVCRGEFEPSAWGASSAVLDGSGHPLAVVSIWGPGTRIGPERFAELGALVRDAAGRLSGSRP